MQFSAHKPTATLCKRYSQLATDLLMNFNTQFLHINLHQFSISVVCTQTYCHSLQAFRPDLLKHSAQRLTSVLLIKKTQYTILAHRPTSVLYIKQIQYTILAHRPTYVLYISSLHTNLLQFHDMGDVGSDSDNDMGSKLVYIQAFRAATSAHASSALLRLNSYCRPALHDPKQQHKHAQVLVHSSSYTGLAGRRQLLVLSCMQSCTLGCSSACVAQTQIFNIACITRVAHTCV